MSAPYCRVYWSIVDDDKFADVFGNDHHLATWLRLLMTADQAWPASASIPMATRRSSLSVLAGCGLVDLQPGGRYRIHGLDSERERRQSHAQSASNARWNARSNAHAFGHGMPRRDEHRRAEQSIAREGLPNVTGVVSDAWSDATGRGLIGSGAFASDYIDDACRRHPESSVVAAIIAARLTFSVIPTPQQLAVAVRARLDPLPDSKDIDKAEREEEAAVRSKRNIAATIGKLHYSHVEPDPRCPWCSGDAA